MTIPRAFFDRAARPIEPQTWVVQGCTPRDQFETCTLTVEQWLSNNDQDGYTPQSKAGKWELLMRASAVALPGVLGEDGLRQEPRIGYDPIGDQPFFLFKASNNGSTFLVSPNGIDLREDELIEFKPPRA